MVTQHELSPMAYKRIEDSLDVLADYAGIFAVAELLNIRKSNDLQRAILEYKTTKKDKRLAPYAVLPVQDALNTLSLITMDLDEIEGAVDKVFEERVEENVELAWKADAEHEIERVAIDKAEELKMANEVTFLMPDDRIERVQKREKANTEKRLISPVEIQRFDGQDKLVVSLNLPFMTFAENIVVSARFGSVMAVPQIPKSHSQEITNPIFSSKEVISTADHRNYLKNLNIIAALPWSVERTRHNCKLEVTVFNTNTKEVETQVFSCDEIKGNTPVVDYRTMKEVEDEDKDKKVSVQEVVNVAA